MNTRTVAVRQLLERAAARVIGADWAVTGGNRLRAILDGETEAIILPLAAGHTVYSVSVNVGPRFPKVERIVAKASRAAGQPETSIRTAAVFPTVFERLSNIASVPDHMPLSEMEQIIEALCSHAVPFICKLRTVGAAADYALANPVPYGHHVVRIPVLLAMADQRREAWEYLDRQASTESPYFEFLTRYRDALTSLL